MSFESRCYSQWEETRCAGVERGDRRPWRDFERELALARSWRHIVAGVVAKAVMLEMRSIVAGREPTKVDLIGQMRRRGWWKCVARVSVPQSEPASSRSSVRVGGHRCDVDRTTLPQCPFNSL